MACIKIQEHAEGGVDGAGAGGAVPRRRHPEWHHRHAFSASANIDILSLDFQSDSPDLPLLASAAPHPSPHRFNRLSWSRPSAAEGDSFSLGLLAGGISDGSVAVWNPLSMISSEGKRRTPWSSGLRSTPGRELTPNRLASGADEGELCIWDLKNPCEPVVYPPLKGSFFCVCKA